MQQGAANLEATTMAALQAVSWQDLWSFTVSKVTASSGSIISREDSIFGRLCQSGGRDISYLAHQTVNLWANLVLKRRDAVLNWISRSVVPVLNLTLRNGPLLGTASLFPREMVDAAVDKRRAEDNDNDCFVHQAVAKTSRSLHATAAQPSGQASTPLALKKTQALKGAHGNTQPSFTSAKKGLQLCSF